MATIKVIDNYSIEIDKNRCHEAREFIKMYINPKDEEHKEIPQYRTIGYYTNVGNALTGIYKDMCIKKASKKDSVTVKEWINIVRECEQIMENVIERNDLE